MNQDILNAFDDSSLSQEEIDQLLGKISMLNIPDSIEEEGEEELKSVRFRGRPRTKPSKVKVEGRGPGRPRTKPLLDPGEKRPVGRPKSKLSTEPKEKRPPGRPKARTTPRPVLIIRVPYTNSGDRTFETFRDSIYKGPMTNDYHILVVVDKTVDTIKADCYTVHPVETINQEELTELLNRYTPYSNNNNL